MSTEREPQVVYSPAAGVRSDFEAILTAFTETHSVRYESFVQIWSDKKMWLMFSGRQTDPECREFVEESLKIALSFWLPPYNFQVRVGGLYLLYGLFFKQLFEPKVKIRITLSQWKEVQSFIIEVKSQQHLDVEFVLTQLMYHNAFHFTAHAIELYPKREHSVSVDQNEEAQKEVLKEQRSVIAEILEPDNIDQLSAIHDQYYRMKCSLAGPDATAPDPSLNVIQPNLVQYITKSVASHEEWRKNKAGKKSGGRKRRDSGGQTTTSESEADSESESGMPPRSPKKKSIGSARAAIREKAFTSVPAASRSRRHRQAILESDALSSSSKKGKRTADAEALEEADTYKHEADEGVMSPMTAVSSALLSMPDLSMLSGVGTQEGSEISKNADSPNVGTSEESSTISKNRTGTKKGKMGPGRPHKI